MTRKDGDPNSTAYAAADRALQQLALRAHLEARQALDLQKDLAAKIRPSMKTEFASGDSVWYWDRDANKIRGG